VSAPSLRRRLQAGLSLSLIFSLGLYGVWNVVNLRDTGEALITARLADDAESLVALLEFDDQGRPRFPESALPRFFHRAYSGHYFLVIAGDEHLASRSLWGHPLPLERLPPGEVRLRHLDGPLDQHLLVRLAGYRKQGRGFTLVLAEDLSQMESRLNRSLLQVAMWSLAVLLLVLWVQARVVRRTLMPLERIQAQMRQMERGERERLDEAVPAEIQPLVRELNRLVAHLEGRLRRSREGLGNLAHTLKGPLAVLAQLVEQPPLQAHPVLQAQFRETLERLSERVERELKRARLAGEGVGKAVFVPGEEVPTLVDLVRRVHGRASLSIHYRIPPGVRYRIDREDALEILGNLLDNAVKWARSTVWLEIAALDHLCVRVEDDGPGVPEAERPRLLDRGARLDERREGQGLGLAIVREAVAHYRGALRLESGERGGLRVVVELPSARRLSPAAGAGVDGASD